MKKVCFLIVSTAIYFISCSSSKESVKFDKDYYNDPYVKKYMNYPDFIAPYTACDYIKEFKKHKYKFLGKGHLTNAWSYFDRNLLDSITFDTNTDSIFFYLAAYTKDTSIDKKFRRHPFVIMQAVQKADVIIHGKGGNEATATLRNSVFFVPKPICPPPNMCRIAGY